MKLAVALGGQYRMLLLMKLARSFFDARSCFRLLAPLRGGSHRSVASHATEQSSRDGRALPLSREGEATSANPLAFADSPTADVVGIAEGLRAQRTWMM
jgi:hypothetical protein